MKKKIAPFDTEAQDRFGCSVAIDGDVIVAGACYDDEMGVNSGSVYIFERNLGGPDNWGQVQPALTASDTAAGDYFGFRVALSGDTIVVGAPYKNNFTGSAYVFERSGSVWAESHTLATALPDISEESDRFGHAVDIDGDTAVVGAFGEWCDGTGWCGAAYVFGRTQADGWGQVRRVQGSILGYGRGFGYSLALSGDRLAVGAIGYFASTKVFFFERDHEGTDGWGETDILEASDTRPEDRFGAAVALAGDLLISGAPWSEPAGGHSGSAYLFERYPGLPDTWGRRAHSGGTSSTFYTNQIETPNWVPGAPSGLAAAPLNQTAVLSWDHAADAETPSPGLTYNLRIGTTPGGIEVMSPNADTATGQRRIVQRGNADHNTSWIIHNLEPGLYYWSVQAIDTAFAGGAFAAEQSFEILQPPSMSVAPFTSAVAGERVRIPLSLTTERNQIREVSFHLDYDEACLSFNSDDMDGDGIPDNVVFHLDAGFLPAVTFDPLRHDGELSISVSGATPADLLTDGGLATITLSTTCYPDTGSTQAAIGFAVSPEPGFRSPDRDYPPVMRGWQLWE